ncbi:MAG: hypothetical protein ACP5FR_02020 [Candidatus Micrarchaeia archaeon]
MPTKNSKNNLYGELEKAVLRADYDTVKKASQQVTKADRGRALLKGIYAALYVSGESSSSFIAASKIGFVDNYLRVMEVLADDGATFDKRDVAFENNSNPLALLAQIYGNVDKNIYLHATKMALEHGDKTLAGAKKFRDSFISETERRISAIASRIIEENGRYLLGIEDRNGKIPLMEAFEVGAFGYASLLISKNKSSLYNADYEGNYSIMYMLRGVKKELQLSERFLESAIDYGIGHGLKADKEDIEREKARARETIATDFKKFYFVVLDKYREKGINDTTNIYGINAIMEAIQSGIPGIVENTYSTFMKSSKSPYVLPNELSMACLAGNVEAVEFLLRKGYKPGVKYGDYLTPYQAARHFLLLTKNIMVYNRMIELLENGENIYKGQYLKLLR